MRGSATDCGEELGAGGARGPLEGVCCGSFLLFNPSQRWPDPPPRPSSPLSTTPGSSDPWRADASALREAFNDASYFKDEAVRAFKLGVLSLEERAQVGLTQGGGGRGLHKRAGCLESLRVSVAGAHVQRRALLVERTDARLQRVG